MQEKASHARLCPENTAIYSCQCLRGQSSFLEHYCFGSFMFCDATLN